MRFMLLVRPWVFLAAGILLASSSSHGEELEVDLSKAAWEPLVELFLPPPESPDRIVISDEGMSIRQVPDVSGRKTGVAGFKMLLPASGDFAVTLECKCLHLEEPIQGWGQGLVLSVFLDDDQQTVLKMARLACPGQGLLCQAEITHLRGDEPPIYRPCKMEFTEGKFVVARTGQEVTFTVDNGKERKVLTTCRCPSADVRSVELGCTRLEKGNTAAEYLLQRLRIQANRFFSYQTPKKPWLTWWRALIAFQVVFLLGLVVVLARRNRG